MTELRPHDTDDLTALLAEVTPELPGATHTVVDRSNPVFTWDYAPTRPALARLTAKARRSQWDPEDLPWDLDVDQERMARSEAALVGGFVGGGDLSGTPMAGWTDAQWIELSIEAQNWMLSQFLHGEQGALLCAGKLVETVPWIEAKAAAALQATDEARHVEVFARYLDTKLSGHYPINAHLRTLLDDILADARWDVTYLGMQVMVEGLALAGFGVIHQLADEPLLVELLRRVMADEARHVAFGVISLREVYDSLSAAEIRERQVLAWEAALLMRDRFAGQEVWARMGVPLETAAEVVTRSPERQLFQTMLFAKIIPNLSKLGLLDAGARPGQPGWLRERFGEIGVLGFEHATDEVDELV